MRMGVDEAWWWTRQGHGSGADWTVGFLLFLSLALVKLALAGDDAATTASPNPASALHGL